MKCTHCGWPESKVVETRRDEAGDVWRRHKCFGCAKSYLTKEVTTAAARMPRRVERIEKRARVKTGITATGENLQGIWR